MVALIRPPSIQSRHDFSSGGFIPPIGVALLSSYLQSRDILVQVIDALGDGLNERRKIAGTEFVVTGLTNEEIISRISSDVDIIGVSCMFSSEWFYIENLILQIRKFHPEKTIVVGGEHATADWKNVLDLCSAVDFCVLGEGEETFVELIQFIRRKSQLKIDEIHSVAFRGPFGAQKNQPRKRLKKLSEMPWPDWNSFPMEKYLENGHSQASINRRSIPILASRGCPFSCTFCTSPNMWGNELNLRDVDDVIAEIQAMHKKYKNEHFDFIDIVGVLNPTWTKELFTRLANLDLPVTWLHGAGTRSEILTPEILDIFKRSKALRLFYAPESGSKVTIKKIKKRVNLDKMIAAMKYTNKLGISMRAPLIIGMPGQTLGEVFESIFFGFKLVWIGVDDVVVHPFSSHPGSELYRFLVQENKIDIPELIRNGKYNEFLTGVTINTVNGRKSWSDEIPGFLIVPLQLGAMGMCYGLQFLIRPHRFAKVLWRVFWKKKPLTLLDHVLYSFFFKTKYKVSYSNMPTYHLSSISGQ